MTDAATPAQAGAPPTTPAPPARPWAEWRERLGRNPVMVKELRGRMRGSRAFWVLSIYLLLMSAFVILLYTVYVAATNSASSGVSNQLVGKFVFGAVVSIELMLVCFIAPAFTAGTISGERERQTFDLLRTTLLPARALVLGKLGSALSFILLLLVAALPLQSLAFLLGGVAIEEVIIASLLLVATAIFYGASGVFFSAIMRRTLASTVLTYAFALFSLLGLPLLLVVLIPLFNIVFINWNPSPVVQAGLMYVFWALLSTNAVGTAIATEIILVSEHSALLFQMPIGPAGNIWLISPWAPYLAFALVTGLVLTLAAVGAVRRAEH
jgi:ABC-type transport system involved in multi-copper enzyme maturation permease subunit